MDTQIFTSVTGIVALSLAAACAYCHLHRQVRIAPAALLVAGSLAVLGNAAYFARSVQAVGAVETFRHGYESTLLLASLLALVGIAAHLTRTLRGLDGFLLIAATVVQLSSLLPRSQPGNPGEYKPWFVTHAFAFAASAALFIAGGAAGVAYLLIHRLLRRKSASSLVGAVAPLESLDRFGRWTLMIGFPLFTYGVLTGICELVRSHDPGPAEWLRDPLVVVSFVTWAVYAAMVGLMWLRPEIRGRRAATMATCGMCLVVLVFLGMEFVSHLHR